mmetsp:Transcript_107879/g.348200  ORF Transcript_107879/g.348200 Transcript_107879/m.348200 type:complete len:247 (+) Transcript_107879:473-1213(+)
MMGGLPRSSGAARAAASAAARALRSPAYAAQCRGKASAGTRGKKGRSLKATCAVAGVRSRTRASTAAASMPGAATHVTSTEAGGKAAALAETKEQAALKASSALAPRTRGRTVQRCRADVGAFSATLTPVMPALRSSGTMSRPCCRLPRPLVLSLRAPAVPRKRSPRAKSCPNASVGSPVPAKTTASAGSAASCPCTSCASSSVPGSGAACPSAPVRAPGGKKAAEKPGPRDCTSVTELAAEVTCT